MGRTIEETDTGYYIANLIQTSTPINPANSGGPLLDHTGAVVCITTAIIDESVELGFAVPSNTILKEIEDLVNYGEYYSHAWLDVSETDMNHYIAEELDIDKTYGWITAEVVSGGPADEAGLMGGDESVEVTSGSVIIGGDIIIAIDGERMVNGDGIF
jgi:S1-C subfamily serine protease